MLDRSQPARRLPGGIYCAPWCGGGCTKLEFDRATREAAQLVVRLNRKFPGTEWQERVWENMGWHYSASFGKFDLSPSLDRHVKGGRHCWKILGYYVALQTSPQIFGDHMMTPEEAVANVVTKATVILKEVEELRSLIKSVERRSPKGGKRGKKSL